MQVAALDFFVGVQSENREVDIERGDFDGLGPFVHLLLDVIRVIFELFVLFAI